MRKSTWASSLIFLAAASVYSGRVIAAGSGKAAKPADARNTDVKLLEEPADTSEPTTQPSESSAPATQPAVPPSMLSNLDGTFSLNITNGADLNETLRVIGFQAQKSVLPSKDVHATLPALDLYNVTVREALDAILKVNGFVYKEEGNFIYVYSAKEAAEMEKANRVQETQVFRVYYMPVADAATMIKPVLSSEGQLSFSRPAMSGLDSGTKDVGGDSHSSQDVMVVTDYPENLERIAKVLKEIDHRPQQILIEATILRASLTDDNALGIDFNIVGGVDFNSITSTNGQITNAQTQTGSTNFGNPVSSVGTGNNFSNSVGNGLKVGFVSNNVSVFLSALEGVTDTVVLANPKVLALNKQKGEVIVGRKDGYLTTTTTDTSTVQTVDFLDTGTRLIFRPYIGDDGYIRMEIHPEDSAGGITSANLPFKITTEVTSNIMVKDGHTIVIGGLFREASDTSRNQVPGLGNLPLAGPLFRQQRDRTVREEIIILLTPHIVKDQNAYAAASEEMLKMAEQYRVGVRNGMMWWGRERLAESCYESAVAEMSKAEPDRSKALWYLDCATNLNPTFMEAIQMKQELTGKVLSSTDNSLIRTFVQKQIMADRATSAAMTPATEDWLDETSAPTTQPSNTSFAASEQPMPSDLSMFADSFTLSAPATQPASESSTTQTTEVASDDLSLTPTANRSSNWGVGSFFGGMRGMFLLRGSGSSTQPSESDASSTKTTITELPMDEADK